MAGMDDYLPIAEHGLIGDLHSVALVGTDGTIDWYCCPRFDSPSVFCAILDKRKGGFWRVAPIHPDCPSKQLYFPDTNVLITRFLTQDGVGEVQDFMPVGEHLDGAHRQRIVRPVGSVGGPRRSPRHVGGDAVSATFSLKENDTATFLLERAPDDFVPRHRHHDETRKMFDGTVAYWRGWLSQSGYRGRWREMVNRSALTLKLLPSQPPGAIVGATHTTHAED